MVARAGVGDILATIDPELRETARQRLATVAPPLDATTLGRLRTERLAAIAPPLPAPPLTTRSVAIAGAPDVTVYVINAQPGAARPAILHMHGGGMVIGSARADIVKLQSLAAELDCVVVTVEYRLAPEASFRVSTRETYGALLWLHRSAAELGVDPDRIAVMGESAGGGHAALLAQAARDRGEVPLVLQVLIYPMLDDRTGSTRAATPGTGTLIWTPAKNRFGWAAFLGQQPGGATMAAGAVPARCGDLKGLPPTFIGVGSIDLFVDEDVDYARRLINAGIPTELLVVPGAYHAFDEIVPASAVARRFTAAKVDALRRAFTRRA